MKWGAGRIYGADLKPRTTYMAITFYRFGMYVAVTQQKIHLFSRKQQGECLDGPLGRALRVGSNALWNGLSREWKNDSAEALLLAVFGSV